MAFILAAWHRWISLTCLRLPAVRRRPSRRTGPDRSRPAVSDRAERLHNRFRRAADPHDQVDAKAKGGDGGRSMSRKEGRKRRRSAAERKLDGDYKPRSRRPREKDRDGHER